uniref:Putative membrane protein YNL320W n=1 Tax=Lygus hesperus TaxID=30085 RepID=A0A0A9X2B4_LYGHE
MKIIVINWQGRCGEIERSATRTYFGLLAHVVDTPPPQPTTPLLSSLNALLPFPKLLHVDTELEIQEDADEQAITRTVSSLLHPLLPLEKQYFATLFAARNDLSQLASKFTNTFAHSLVGSTLLSLILSVYIHLLQHPDAVVVKNSFVTVRSILPYIFLQKAYTVLLTLVHTLGTLFVSVATATS